MPAVNTARERAEQDPVIWLIGLAAGFAAAFPGLGGGLVLVPALFLLLRRPIKQAIGTSLAVVLFVSLAAILADWEVGGVRIRWTWALLLAAGSLLGSVIGGRLIGRIADSPLRLALAGVLVVSSIPAFTGSLVGSPGPKGSLGSLIAAPPLLGTIPALALLVGDLPLDAMRGTSLPAILVAAGIGAREHARFGHLERRLAEALVPAGLAGAVLGVVAMAHLPVRICEVGLAALLVVAAIRLLAQVFHPSALSRWGSQFGRRGRQPDANAR
jgi:uncharacterized membrane protein YfcA